MGEPLRGIAELPAQLGCWAELRCAPVNLIGQVGLPGKEGVAELSSGLKGHDDLSVGLRQGHLISVTNKNMACLQSRAVVVKFQLCKV